MMKPSVDEQRARLEAQRGKPFRKPPTKAQVARNTERARAKSRARKDSLVTAKVAAATAHYREQLVAAVKLECEVAMVGLEDRLVGVAQTVVLKLTEQLRGQVETLAQELLRMGARVRELEDAKALSERDP
jgi:hypothetical protein